jgi:ATP synthase protein I
MSDKTPSDPLARLGEKIEQARREQLRRKGNGRGGAPQGPFGLAFRIAIELVAALCVGLAIGWGLDRVLGTRPWGLIVFFFIGAAAGMLNVFRAAKELGRNPPAEPDRDRRDRE